MKCLVCRASFFEQTHQSPAEDCDCSQRVTLLILRESPEFDLDGAIKDWCDLHEPQPAEDVDAAPI